MGVVICKIIKNEIEKVNLGRTMGTLCRGERLLPSDLDILESSAWSFTPHVQYAYSGVTNT